MDDDPTKAEFVGTLARDNPWEVLHKVLHGQPGSAESSFGRMPSAAGSHWTTDDVLDLLRYCQESLPN